MPQDTMNLIFTAAIRHFEAFDDHFSSDLMTTSLSRFVSEVNARYHCFVKHDIYFVHNLDAAGVFLNINNLFVRLVIAIKIEGN